MSQVTTTKDMFSFAYSFAGDVSTWNVSNNRDFGYMFSSCLSFNSNLSAWDVSNADQIVEMFNGATSFIGEGLSNWNLGKKVASLEYMFNGAASFNGNISSWDVSRIQYMDYMVR
jgi:surface protein